MIGQENQILLANIAQPGTVRIASNVTSGVTQNCYATVAITSARYW